MAKLHSDITEDGGNKELLSGSSLNESFIGSCFGAYDVALYIWGMGPSIESAPRSHRL